MVNIAKRDIFVASTMGALRETIESAIIEARQFPVLIERLGSAGARSLRELVEREIAAADGVLLLAEAKAGTHIEPGGGTFLELEYEIAKRHSKPLLVLLPSNERFERGLALARKSAEDRNRLLNFRQRLEAGTNTVAYYENAEELKIRILELLPKLVESLDAPPKHVGSLELAFDDEATVEFVIERLRSLQRLYTAVCRLAGVSISRFPLTVQQLEVGSLWLKLFGESRIIAVCSKVIDAAIRHLYRHHTRERQVAEIPNQISRVST